MWFICWVSKFVNGWVVGLKVIVFIFWCNKVFSIVVFEFSDILCFVELFLNMMVILLNILVVMVFFNEKLVIGYFFFVIC